MRVVTYDVEAVTAAEYFTSASDSRNRRKNSYGIFDAYICLKSYDTSGDSVVDIEFADQLY